MILDPILFTNYIEESISSLIILTSIRSINNKDKKHLCVKVFLYIFITSICGCIGETIIESFALLKTIQIASEIILILYLFKSNISETISLYAIYYSLIYLIQEPIAFTFHFFITDISSPKFGLLANLITIIICLIIKKCTPIRKYYNMLVEKKTASRVIIVNVFVIIQVIDYYYKMKMDIYRMNMLFVIICILIIVILNFLIIYEEQTIHLKEEELNTTRINATLMDNMITEIRRNQHQYDDRINALVSLATICEDYDSLKTELLKHADTIIRENDNYDVLKLNYKLVAALIFSKINEARAADIQMLVDIKNYNITTIIPENELIDILGIIINNMIEASLPKSTCTLTLESIDNRLIIKSKNEGPKLTTELQNKLFTKGYTTKTVEKERKKHGYGLYNLRRTVLKYNGNFSVMNEYSADRLKTYIVFTVEV